MSLTGQFASIVKDLTRHESLVLVVRLLGLATGGRGLSPWTAYVVSGTVLDSVLVRRLQNGGCTREATTARMSPSRCRRMS